MLMLGSLLFIFVIAAFFVALVWGSVLGLGSLLRVLQDSYSAFQHGLKGESVVK